MTKIQEKIYRSEVFTGAKKESGKKIPIAAKIVAGITIVACLINIPILVSYIIGLFKGFIYNEFTEQTTTYLILYSIFLAAMALLVACLLSSAVFLLLNNRRKCAMSLDLGAWSSGIAAISDIMIVGIKPETIILSFAIIAFIIAKTYIDPSLSYERNQHRKENLIQEKKDYDEGKIGQAKDGHGFAKFNYFNVLWIFVCFAVLGYLWEALWHMIVDDPGVYQERAGFLFGPFSPIYGLGGLLISVVVNRLHDKNPVIIFILCAALGGMFEFFVSWFLETSFGIRSWDYSHLPFNIDGRVSLRFFIMWGVIGLIYVKLAFKPLIRGINKIPWKWRYTLTILMSIVVWGNAIMTLQSLDCWYQRSIGKEMNTPIEQFYNTYFDDEFMHNRFQNMVMESDNAVRTQIEETEMQIAENSNN